MKKLICTALSAITVLGLVSMSGCGDNNDIVVDISTPQPESTSVIAQVPTEVADFTAAPTFEAVTAQPTDAPVETTAPTDAVTPTDGSGEEKPDQSVFDDTVFIGNSIFEGLYRFGIITHGKFFTKVGLNVNSVMTDSADGSSVPIIDEMKDGSYGKVVILLGTNELGWPNYTTFISKYSGLIDAVWQRQPGIKVFITALPPVSEKTDQTNSNGVNNANIQKMNGLLKELASTKGVYFIDVPSSLYDANGCLPEEASSDGIHLNLKYDRIWADHITLKVTENN